jgi:hypothetical protein
LREPTGSRGYSLQAPEVLTGVRLDGVRGVVVVRDAAEQVEKFSGRQWWGPADVVMGHVRTVINGAAQQWRGTCGGGRVTPKTFPAGTEDGISCVTLTGLTPS